MVLIEMECASAAALVRAARGHWRVVRPSKPIATAFAASLALAAPGELAVATDTIDSHVHTAAGAIDPSWHGQPGMTTQAGTANVDELRQRTVPVPRATAGAAIP